MIWGIILYYLWIVLALYLSYVLLFCTYDDEERVKFPIYMFVGMFVVAFVPVVNVVETILICVVMYALHDENDYEDKTFLFKQI